MIPTNTCYLRWLPWELTGLGLASTCTLLLLIFGGGDWTERIAFILYLAIVVLFPLVVLLRVCTQLGQLSRDLSWRDQLAASPIRPLDYLRELIVPRILPSFVLFWLSIVFLAISFVPEGEVRLRTLHFVFSAFLGFSMIPNALIALGYCLILVFRSGGGSGGGTLLPMFIYLLLSGSCYFLMRVVISPIPDFETALLAAAALVGGLTAIAYVVLQQAGPIAARQLFQSEPCADFRR